MPHGFIVVVFVMAIDPKNDNKPSGDEHVKCKSSFDTKGENTQLENYELFDSDAN